MEKFSVEMIGEIKEKYMQKFGIGKAFVNDKIIVLPYKNEKLLALVN